MDNTISTLIDEINGLEVAVEQFQDNGEYQLRFRVRGTLIKVGGTDYYSVCVKRDGSLESVVYLKPEDVKHLIKDRYIFPLIVLK